MADIETPLTPEFAGWPESLPEEVFFGHIGELASRDIESGCNVFVDLAQSPNPLHRAAAASILVEVTTSRYKDREDVSRSAEKLRGDEDPVVRETYQMTVWPTINYDARRLTHPNMRERAQMRQAHRNHHSGHSAYFE